MALTIRRLIPKVSTLKSKIFGLHGVHTSFLLNNSVCDARKKTRSRCTLIPGDGVGPELVEAVQDVFKHMNVPVDFESFQLSETGPETSTPFEYVANSITRNRVCLKGIIGSPGMEESNKLQTLNMKMRKELDLYANVVHIRSLDGVNAKHKNIDLVVIREHTEGEYSALEHEVVKGVVECLKVVTAWKSQRIAKFAFDYATRHNRKKVTAVHKANIMKLGDGLFLKSCREVSKHYPHIEYQTIIVDNCTMQMVSKPQQFDVLLTPNLYGNLVDNIGAGLVGGAGVVAGASYSADCVVFEPGARHRFIEAAGKNIANPTALLLCSALLLDHLNLDSHAKAIKSAVEKVLKDGAVKTADLGGNASTKDFTEAVIANVQPDGGRT